MLKSVYGEEYLSRTSVFEWHESFRKCSERENTKIAGENIVDSISDAEIIIHHEFMPEK
jgi:hypothetical protein